MATRPKGPHSLYWAYRIQGANAYRAGKVIAEYPQRPGALDAEHGGVGHHEDLRPDERSGLRAVRATALAADSAAGQADVIR
jgi:hypothetical protein